MDVDWIRKEFPILERLVNGRPLVYLDNAATMQVPRCVIERVSKHYSTSNANVHRGTHKLAAESTDALERSRKSVADFIGSSDNNAVVFTRGTTDSLNIIASGLARALKPGDAIVATVMEHHSNFVPWQQLCKATGSVFRVVGLDGKGDLDFGQFDRFLSEGNVRLVAMTGCSNILGTVNPVERAARSAHTVGSLFVLDAAQMVRHCVMDVSALDCDFVAFSGHKMMSGTGIGVLGGKREALELLRPAAFGGEMVGEVFEDSSSWADLPLRLEPGTPNYVGSVALAEAIGYMMELGRGEIASREAILLDRVVTGLRGIKGVRIVGDPVKRSGCVSFVSEGVHPFDLCMLLDRYGIALRSGHNCAQPLLRALGLASVSRISPAFYNTEEEVDLALDCIEHSVRKLRSLGALL